MAETDADPITTWEQRVGTLRKRGRVSSAALSVVPQDEVDVRRGRPPAPERFLATERVLWDKLVCARRPGWFSGAEELLESYVVIVCQVQQIEAALRKLKPGAGDRFMKLSKLHQHSVALTSSLATRLRLSPHSRVQKSQPTDGDLPLMT